MAVEGWRVGVNDRGLNHFTYKAAFSTLTNVDFDGDRFVNLISETVRRRDELKARVKAASGQVDFGEGPAVFEPEATKDGMVARAKKSVSSPILISTQIILSLRELLIYGIKGDAGYADHAAILGKEDDAVYAFIHEAMASTLNKDMSSSKIRTKPYNHKDMINNHPIHYPIFKEHIHPVFRYNLFDGT